MIGIATPDDYQTLRAISTDILIKFISFININSIKSFKEFRKELESKERIEEVRSWLEANKDVTAIEILDWIDNNKKIDIKAT